MKSHRTVSSQCNSTLDTKLVDDYIFITITLTYVMTEYLKIHFCYALLVSEKLQLLWQITLYSRYECVAIRKLDSNSYKYQRSTHHSVF